MVISVYLTNLMPSICPSVQWYLPQSSQERAGNGRKGRKWWKEVERGKLKIRSEDNPPPAFSCIFDFGHMQ